MYYPLANKQNHNPCHVIAFTLQCCKWRVPLCLIVVLCDLDASVCMQVYLYSLPLA